MDVEFFCLHNVLFENRHSICINRQTAPISVTIMHFQKKVIHIIHNSVQMWKPLILLEFLVKIRLLNFRFICYNVVGERGSSYDRHNITYEKQIHGYLRIQYLY